MADYAYAFNAPPTHPYYQHPATQWDTPRTFSIPTQAQSSPPGRHAHTSSSSQSLVAQPQQPAQPQQQPASLLWTSLEPWMDQEYARQVCSLLGWDARVRVPPLNGAVVGGTMANNAGYAVLTFSSSAAATAALTQISSGASPIASVTGSSGSSPSTTSSNPTSMMTMPNSSRSFVMGWAPAGLAVAPTASPPSSSPPSTTSSYPNVVSPTSPLSPVSAVSGHSNGYSGYTHAMSVHSAPSQTSPYPKEYSIFVGDLAPETSNSDLVAVFRNPVLGLRNDRAPKFIRPFTSCKSAKIMLDPVTGVSRGYGFVRFTDEADQQRALIEMHGLYCLSRPMRISPATAKFKPTTTTEGAVLAGSSSLGNVGAANETVPLPPSVSAPIATASYYIQAPGRSDPSQPNGNAQPSTIPPVLPPSVQQPPASVFFASDPSSLSSTAAEWKHHAHARAIFGNLIGPNGEQLTSTDPYNTTVFVGGLSPLVGEETLRTFFVPFGEIHYVKVPVGKNCGFVQFVRKVDAEQAIEKMQGFPVGGNRIRLSWGRSQYKAAQAAAQAAQVTALQVPQQPPSLPPSQQPQVPVPSATGITPQMLAEMTKEQIVVLLQKFGPQALFGGNGGCGSNTSAATTTTGYAPNTTTTDQYRGFNASPSSTTPTTHAPQYTGEGMKVAVRRDDGPFGHGFGQRPASASSSSFSPFSPDPNAHHPQQQQPQPSGLYPHLPAQDMLAMRRDSYSGVLPLPPTNTSKSYAPGWITGASAGGSSSPTRGYASGVGVGFSSRTTSPPSFQVNHYQVPPDSSSSRQPISRPTSGVSVREEDTREWMDDLNGTLASLDLGLGWGWGSLKTRSAPASEESASASSGGSGSVQFRMTPSP